MAISFTGFPDATSFADIERSVMAAFEAAVAATPAGQLPQVIDPRSISFPQPPPPPPPPPPPRDPLGFIPDFLRPIVPDLPDIEDLLEGLEGFIQEQLGINLEGIEESIEGIIDKIRNPIAAIQSAVDIVAGSVTAGITNTIEAVRTRSTQVISTIEDKIGDAFDSTLGTIERIIDGVTSTVTGAFDTIQSGFDSALTFLGEIIEKGLEQSQEFAQASLILVGDKITAATEASAAAIEASVGVPFAKLADVLPFQIAELGETISDSLSSIQDIPELLGEKIKGVFAELSSTLGLDNLLHFTQILQAVFSLGDFHTTIRGNGLGLLGLEEGIHSQKDVEFIATTAIPFIGSAMLMSHPGRAERIRQDSMEHERPTVIGLPDGLELLRRFPEESDMVIADLKRGGWSDERIEQLTRLRFQLTPLGDTLDGWRRGFISDDGLTDKMVDLGITTSDQALFKRLTFRIPPIQDMILFAIRGVFDVEESRAFGEFEGLPSELEAEFIRDFDIEGGDFSRQVEVFAREAQKIGLSPAWVAAYWTSHWRLPSLQTAYEMFHRLQPDILEAESDRVASDGFSVQELEFTRPELDRLVRAQDFSSFWRPKLSAIAFNPLTRVDIRRIAKLLDKDKEWMIIQYRKVGFSPFDANLMADFTIAFNAEPDQDQAREVRDLTKTVVLDFVETSIFTPEEGVERLQSIGYDEFAAKALVDLEIAKVERALQRDQIDLVEEQVKLQILNLNSASIELDRIGVPAAQKQVIIRKLGVAIAPRPASPSKSDLDNFLNQSIITTMEYREGLTERGFNDFWIDHYIALDRRLRTKKEMDTLFIEEILPIGEYIQGLVDLGYSEATIEQFVALIEQAQSEAKEEGS